MVTLHTAIHDCLISLLRNALLGDLGIDPVWETPHFGVNLSKLHRRAGVIGDYLLECRVELAVVEEDIWIVIPSVEMAFNGFYGLDDAV